MLPHYNFTYHSFHRYFRHNKTEGTLQQSRPNDVQRCSVSQFVARWEIEYGNHQFEYRLGIQVEEALKARGQFNKHIPAYTKSNETP
jgi:hypothetical protein